jgi:hypothetical protein
MLARPSEFTVENYDIVLSTGEVTKALLNGGLIDDFKYGKSALYDFYSKLYVWATELPDSLGRISDFLSDLDKIFLCEVLDANNPKDLLEIRLPKVIGFEIDKDPFLFVESLLSFKARIEASCDFILNDLTSLICEVFDLSNKTYRLDIKEYLSTVKTKSLGDFSVLYFRLCSEIPDDNLYLKAVFESLFNVRFGSHKLDDVSDLSAVRSRLELLREFIELNKNDDIRAKVVFLKKDAESLVLSIPKGTTSKGEEYNSLRTELLKLSADDRVSLLFEIIE